MSLDELCLKDASTEPDTRKTLKSSPRVLVVSAPTIVEPCTEWSYGRHDEHGTITLSSNGTFAAVQVSPTRESRTIVAWLFGVASRKTSITDDGTFRNKNCAVKELIESSQYCQELAILIYCIL